MKVSAKTGYIIAIVALILIWAEFLTFVALDQRSESAIPQSPADEDPVREVMYNVDPNGNPHYIWVNRRPDTYQPRDSLVVAVILVQIAGLIVFLRHMDKELIRNHAEGGER